MEFLFPFKKRQSILSRPSPPDFAVIAKQYLVPELMIDKYLSTIFVNALEGESRK